MDETGVPVLTGEEVGALFAAVQGASLGAAAPAVERPFEPRALEGGSEELVRLIARVMGVVAFEAGAALGALLRLAVTLETGAVAEAEPADVALSGAEVRIGLRTAGGAGLGALLFDDNLVRAAADRLLGGPGVPSAVARPLTALEKGIAERALRALAQALGAAWRPWTTTELKAEVAREERALPLEAPLLSAPLRLRLGELEVPGIALYFPGPLGRATGSAPAACEGASLAGRLEGIPLGVSFLAPDFTLTVGELLALAPGTTLALARASELRVDVRVEDRTRLRGRLVIDKTGARTVAIDERLARGATP